MDSPFFYKLTLYQGANSGPATASWVTRLPLVQQIVDQVVVIPETDGSINPGMYVWDGSRWRFILPYTEVAQAIIDGSTLDVFYNVTADFSGLPPTVELWRNGLPFDGDVVVGGQNAVWIGVTKQQSGDVSSVNGIVPDAFGNVELNITPYVLPVATTTVLGGVKQGANINIAPDGTISVNISGSGVQTVSGQGPDGGGNVVVKATDSVPASGHSLIVNSGATTANITLNTLSPGAGIAINAATGTLDIVNTGVLTVNGTAPDGNGNVVVSSSYVLPVATTTVLGGVKQGANVTIAGDGTISVAAPTAPYVLPQASSSVLGGVKIGANVTEAGDGTISVAAPYVLPIATATVLGGVKQGANITIAGDGTISGAAPYVLPIATSSVLGGVKQGTNVTIAADGTISASGAVQSVSGQTGAVVVQASDNNAATGTSLIANSGATTGNIKLNTLVSGQNITIAPDVNGNLVISSSGGGTGSVQSVALALPSIFAVSGSPVTSTGTLTGTLAGQNANWVFAGPVSGSADIPAFRALRGADLPLSTTALVGGVITGSGLAVSVGGVISNAGVTKFNTRTGDVVLIASDMVNQSTGAFLVDSPAFTGVPTAPTAAPTTSTIQLATTAFVQAAITAFNLPPATTSTLGGVIVGNGLSVNGGGTVSNSGVLSFNTRTGAVTLAAGDLVDGTGKFLLGSAVLTGIPTADTASPGTNTAQLATTAFVAAAVTAGSVTSFNTRTGAVVLSAADITSATGALLANPAFTGVPTAPTAAPGVATQQLATTGFVAASFAPLASPALVGIPTAPTAINATNTTQLATTAFVHSLVAASGVSTFNTRAGAVTLQATDLQVGNVVGGAFILGSPSFTGVPVAPTASTGTSTTQIATTAFVATSFAPLASPALTGVPTAPTAIGGTNTTQIATTAFVAANFVSSVSPALTGVPTAPTAATATNTTQIATTAFAQALFASLTLPPATSTTLGGVIVKAGLTVDGSGNLSANVTSVAGRGGAVVLTVSDVSGAAPLASPVFTGSPTAPTTAVGDNSNNLATTAYVETAVNGATSVTLAGSHTLAASEYGVGTIGLNGALTVNAVVTFPTAGKWTVINSTSGAFTVTLQSGNGSGSTIVIPQGATADVVASGNSLLFAGQLGITRPISDNTTYLATTAFVAEAIGGLASGVTTFNTRAGAVTLQATDISGVGGALLASPAFTGVPTAPTAVASDSSTQIATTAFVATTFAKLASPTFTGNPLAPTAAPGNNTTQIATTGFVAASFAPLASPVFSGVPAAPTAAQGTSSTQLATTAFVQRMLSATVTIALTNANVTLTAAQYSTEIIEFTGTLTASVIITVPTSGQWIIYNNTTGAFNVTLSNGSGSTYVVPQNESAAVVSLTTIGIVNANIAGNVLTPATATTIGGVIVPNAGGLVVDVSGNISVTAATGSVIGGVIVGAGLTITGSTISANVLTVAGRAGAVTLTIADVTGAAPLASPALSGVPTAPTAAPGNNTTQIATTAFVAAAVSGASVTSFNTRTGAVTLQATDVTAVGGALLASPTFTGIPAAPTAAQGTNTTQLATTAYVMAAAFAPIASPTFTGVPLAPTAAPGTNTTQIATTAFVTAAVTAVTAGVTSFNTRTGVVTLQATDVTGVGGALLASPTFTGIPAAPTATAGNNTTQIATTAFVATSFAPINGPVFTGVPLAPTAASGTITTQLATTAFVYASTQGQTTIALTNANVTLTAAQYCNPVVKFTGALTGNVLITFPLASGNWTVINSTSGAFTLTLTNTGGSTLVIPTGGSASVVSDSSLGMISGTTSGGAVQSVNGLTGTVTLGVANITGAAPIASPVFTGRAQSPAYSFTITSLSSSTAQAISLATATEYAFTVTAATTVTFSGTPAAGTSGMVILRVTNGGLGVTWNGGTATITYAGKVAPVLTTAGVDLIGVLWDPTASTSTYMLFVIGLNVG